MRSGSSSLLVVAAAWVSAVTAPAPGLAGQNKAEQGGLAAEVNGWRRCDSGCSREETVALIHAGPAKTGTTFIQNVLSANRDELLRSRGLYYPSDSHGDVPGTTEASSTAHHALASRLSDERYAKAWADDLCGRSCNETAVVVSSEALSLAKAPALSTLRHVLLPRPTTAVLVYRILKNEEVSLYQQNLAAMAYPPSNGVRVAKSFSSFFESRRAAAANFLGTAVQRLAQAFGTVKIIDYRDASLHVPGGLVNALLASAGLDPLTQDQIDKGKDNYLRSPRGGHTSSGDELFRRLLGVFALYARTRRNCTFVWAPRGNDVRQKLTLARYSLDNYTYRLSLEPLEALALHTDRDFYATYHNSFVWFREPPRDNAGVCRTWTCQTIRHPPHQMLELDLDRILQDADVWIPRFEEQLQSLPALPNQARCRPG